jgi:hypothetical protein
MAVIGFGRHYGFVMFAESQFILSATKIDPAQPPLPQQVRGAWNDYLRGGA